MMKKPEILIVGYGVVGKNIHKLFPNADVFDKYDGSVNTKKDILYDCAFICVPTPANKDGSCNYDEVEEAIQETNAKVIVIKSTIPPGTTDKLKEKYRKRLVFSPEYYGETQHANVGYDFQILGGDPKDTEQVAQIMQHYFTGFVKIMQVDAKTAELTKYMENAYLATKVVFCNTFYRLAKKLGVNYSLLRECFILDPRVNPSHTFVYREAPYYDSKCFNKDLPAILHFTDYEPELIKAVIEINEKFKRESCKN